MSFYYKYYKYKEKYNNLLGGMEEEECKCGSMFCETCLGKQPNDLPSVTNPYEPAYEVDTSKGEEYGDYKDPVNPPNYVEEDPFQEKDDRDYPYGNAYTIDDYDYDQVDSFQEDDDRDNTDPERGPVNPTNYVKEVPFEVEEVPFEVEEEEKEDYMDHKRVINYHQSKDDIKCCSNFNDPQKGSLCALHACNNLLQRLDPDGLNSLQHFCQQEIASYRNTTNRNCTGNFIDTVVYQYLIERSELENTSEGKWFDVSADYQPFFKFNKDIILIEDEMIVTQFRNRLREKGYTENQIDYGLARSETLDGIIAVINNQIQDDDDDDDDKPIWQLGNFRPVSEAQLLHELSDSQRNIPPGRSLLGYIIKVPGHYIAIRVSNSEEGCKPYCFVDSIGTYIKNGDANDMISELKTHCYPPCWKETVINSGYIYSLIESHPMVIKVLSVD